MPHQVATVGAARAAGTWWPNQTPTPENYAIAVASLRDICIACANAPEDSDAAKGAYIAQSALRDMGESE